MQKFQAIAEGDGVMDRYNAPGPLLAYEPSKVSDPPTTPEALLAWAKAHPGKFTYPSPPASGPGYTFLQSLPYLLGDKDPSDPVNGWPKTWDYLAKLGKYITSYPASSTIGSQQFGSGEVQLEPSPGEAESRRLRRSLYVVHDVAVGDEVTPHNVRSIRPAGGLEPAELDVVLGRRFTQDVSRGTPLTWDLV